ncbi:MAG TPA: hypothetical protein VLA93_06545 [Pyrinomonadaceae bacterium]|nr:hypothetical protein [Pyrinomonadaceae bacterium]
MYSVPPWWSFPSSYPTTEHRDGQSGYMAEEFIRSPIDYRAGFAKQEGRWVMIFFIAGD